MSLSRDLAEKVLAISTAALPPAAVDAARISLADAIAVMLAATQLEPATHPFHRHALAAGGGPATLLAGGTSSAALAAFANGALSHALDYEDTMDTTGIHPNAVIIPAALAVAEAENRSGADLLAAIAIGCDMSCRLAAALQSDPARRGWYFPPMIAAAGATFGLAHMKQLSADQTVDALGLTLTQFSLTDELKRSPDSSLRAVRDGFAARAVVEACELALQGVKSIKAPLEGASGLFALLTGTTANTEAFIGLGQEFAGPEATLKQWPCCRGTHAYVAAALQLRQHGVSALDIKTVTADVRPPDDMLLHPLEDRRRPRTKALAKFSIPYCIAVSLITGRIDLSSFTEQMLQDAEIIGVSGKVSPGRILDSAGNEPAKLSVQMVDDKLLDIPVQMPAPRRAGQSNLEVMAPKLGDCFERAGKGPIYPVFIAWLRNLPEARNAKGLYDILRHESADSADT